MPKPPYIPAIANTNERVKRVAKPSRIDLRLNEVDALIEDQGCFVKITPCLLCPNRTAVEDTNHALDCPICDGNQVLELHGNAVEDWVFIQGIKLEHKFEVAGIWDVKDALMTIKSEIRVSYWFKVEVLDFGTPFNQIMKRHSDDTDKLRYAPQPDFKIPFYLVDSTGKRYEYLTDYKVTEKSLLWLTSNRPAIGSLYSILYPVYPTFRVLETLHDNRYYYTSYKSPIKKPVHLPQQCVLRWDYLATRSGMRELRTENE